MFRSIGTNELLLLAGVVVLFLFGGKKIPEFFKGLGDAVREFKKASRDDDDGDKPKSKKS